MPAPAASPPHGGVDRNRREQPAKRAGNGSPPHGGVDRNLASMDQQVAAAASPPHGGVDRNRGDKLRIGGFDEVAPSRGRGSKPPSRAGDSGGKLSPPHGGVDRNEMTEFKFHIKMPMSPPHGGVDRNMRGAEKDAALCRRPLTGAWIETSPTSASCARPSRRPLTGAWIETFRPKPAPQRRPGRPLTGAWIETGAGRRMCT